MIKGFKTSASKTLPGAHGAGVLGEVHEHEYEVADHLALLLCYNNLLFESRGNQMIPTFQAACKSRATRLGVPPSPDELAAFDQSENLTSMHFKQLYSVLGLPLVQNKKKNLLIY